MVFIWNSLWSWNSFSSVEKLYYFSLTEYEKLTLAINNISDKFEIELFAA